MRIFDDGTQFAPASFRVTTLGTEVLTGASGTYILPNFPTTGQNVTVQWRESLQTFVLIGAPGTAACDASSPTVGIPPPPPDLDCGDSPYDNFTVLPLDPHGCDADEDGIGCEQ